MYCSENPEESAIQTFLGEGNQFLTPQDHRGQKFDAETASSPGFSSFYASLGILAT